MKAELQNSREVELKDICEIRKGNSITKDKVTEGNIPVIAGGQQPAYYHNVSNRTGETITVSGSGAYAGFVAYFNNPIFASDCSTIQTKSKDVSMKYIYFLLKNKQKIIYDFQRGIAQPHVYPKDLAKIKIIIPTISTQQKIVSILEKAEKLKELREEADKLTKDFLRAVFLEMFGKFIFNKKAYRPLLKDVLIRIDSGTSPICEPHPRSKPEQIAVLKLGSVTYGFFNPDENKYLPPKTEIKKKVSVKKDDLLFSRKNTHDLVGATAFVFESDENLLLPDTIFKLVYDKNKINGIYLWKLLSEPNFKKLVENLATGSAGSMPNISKERLMKFKIPIPPMDLQIKFAEMVKNIESIKKHQKHSKEFLDNMFNVTLQKAFKGELAC